jgi:magnesium chelatase family protein
MPAKTFAPALFGLDGQLIEIECDLANGLPGFVVVGLGDKAVDEARERVRSAIRNSGLYLPQKRLTLNLAPADLPKDGTGYDLGMAVSILIASQQIKADAADGTLFFGELALDGSIRPVRGALLAAELAARSGFKRIVVAEQNAAEASLIEQLEVWSVGQFKQLYRLLTGDLSISVVARTTVTLKPKPTPAAVDLNEVYGQDQAKRALEIAAAGGHNLLLSGPPGAGKTLLSKAFIGLLPPPSFEEMIEITKLYSLAGLADSNLVRQRPFRAPHHTASSVALIGGGTIPRPGEISLSHRGVLFLDELPEFPRSVLEVLRQPLEEGKVTVARAARVVTFPADFTLIATRNPCPCGYAGDTRQACTCTLSQVTRYQRKLSGPLLDRVDLIVDVARVEQQELLTGHSREPSAAVAKRVASARAIQSKRYAKTSYHLNSQMTNLALRKYCGLAEDTTPLARAAISRFNLSARAYSRVLKVARTIADLEGAAKIQTSHFAEALQYRPRS